MARMRGKEGRREGGREGGGQGEQALGSLMDVWARTCSLPILVYLFQRKAGPLQGTGPDARADQVVADDGGGDGFLQPPQLLPRIVPLLGSTHPHRELQMR